MMSNHHHHHHDYCQRPSSTHRGRRYNRQKNKSLSLCSECLVAASVSKFVGVIMIASLLFVVSVPGVDAFDTMTYRRPKQSLVMQQTSFAHAAVATTMTKDSIATSQRQQGSTVPLYAVSRETDDDAFFASSYSSSTQQLQTPSLYLSLATLGSVGVLILYSLLLALLLITWEDVTCTYTLSSRHARTALEILSTTQDHEQHHRPSSSSSSSSSSSWGRSTVGGLAFGQTQRLQLVDAWSSNVDATTIDSAVMPQLESYNEVMLRHRQERVVRWRQEQSDGHIAATAASAKSSISVKSDMTTTTTTSAASAIHVLCDCLKQVWALRAMAADYRWNEMHDLLRQPPLTQLEPAASYLRRASIMTTSSSSSSSSNGGGGMLRSLNNGDDSSVASVIGFDWGSCAWRSNACGGLADAEESLDQLDFLTGLLEPYEAIFCLDIVERSIRDILAVVIPLQEQQQRLQQQQQQSGTSATQPQDYVYSQNVAFWKATSNKYKPHRIFPPVDTKQGEYGMDNEAASLDQTIDEDYLDAIQNLRIE